MEFKVGDKIEVAIDFGHPVYHKGTQGIVIAVHESIIAKLQIRMHGDLKDTFWPEAGGYLKLKGPRFKRNLPVWW